MKTIIKSLAVVVAAITFTACSKPTIDPVRPARPATSIVLPVTPAQPQPIADQLDAEQPTTEHPDKFAPEMPTRSDQQPATVGNPNPQPIPRPAQPQQPVHKAEQLTAVSDSLM